VKASLVTYKYGLKNKIFDISINNNARKFYYLRKILEENNINLDTFDINPQEESVLSIYLDVNKKALTQKRSPKNILIVRESPIINKDNDKNYYLKKFNLIITWNRTLCDQKKIFWAGYGNCSELRIKDPLEIYKKKKKDLCIINSKKYSNSNNELYKEREKAIDFFNKSDLSFDLFGYGWDKRQFKGILKPFNRVSFARNFLYQPNPSYKGTVKSKEDILSKYKYSLCFENCIKTGYITEKIFDSMFSGCIPIYLGCPNIENEIGKDTFIDVRDFSSYKELYKYLIKMPKKEYLFKINKIISFYDEYIKTTFYDAAWADYVAKKCLSLVNNS